MIGHPGTTASTIPPGTRPVSIGELQRAWNAVQAGSVRAIAAPSPADPDANPDALTHAPVPVGCGLPDPGRVLTEAGPVVWEAAADERVLPVIGCAGTVGTTTLALALATSSSGTARVVECASATVSGLGSASTAELGLDVTGWRRGRRDRVLLERLGHVLSHPDELPAPIPALTTKSAPEAAINQLRDHDPPAQLEHLTVLDVSLPVEQLLTVDCWLSRQILQAPALVLVTIATVHGWRRLEGALALLDATRRAAEAKRPAGQDELGEQMVHVAVVGPPRKKWAKILTSSAGLHTRRLLEGPGRVWTVPVDRVLFVRGLDSAPLPRPILESAHDLLHHIAAPGYAVNDTALPAAQPPDRSPDRRDLRHRLAQ